MKNENVESVTENNYSLSCRDLFDKKYLNSIRFLSIFVFTFFVAVAILHKSTLPKKQRCGQSTNFIRGDCIFNFCLPFSTSRS